MPFIYTSIWAQRYFPFYFGAIFFYSNLELLQTEGDYFSDTTEKMPFLHTWSLGVEMQFYLVAPIFFYVSKIDSKNKSGHLILIGALLISLYFYCNTLAITSFYHPFGRMWQFLCGMLASLYTERTKTALTSRQANLLSSVFLSVSSLIFFPYFFKVTPPSFLQFLVTISSSGFILTGAKSTTHWSHFRLGYIAKISYALYLVHFPVLRFIEYLVEYHEKEINASLLALFITFLLSIYAHHSFEAPLLKAKSLDIVHQTLKYLLLALLVCWKWEVIVRSDCVPSMAVAENSKFKTSLYRLNGAHFVDEGFADQRRPFGHYVYEGNTGKLKIVIMGNSWAAQEAHLVRKFFPKNETAEMHLFTQSSAAFGLHGMNDEIKKHTPFLLNFLKKLQPDYVFLLLRYNWKAGDLEPYEGPGDKVMETYWEGIEKISEHTKKLFIQTHQPFGCLAKNNDFLNRFLDGLQKTKDLETFNQPFNKTDYYNSVVHQRLKVIMERCKKCHLIDITDAFVDSKRNLVLTYDPKTSLSYFDNQCHMTASGLKKIEKVFLLEIQAGLKEN